MEIKFRFSRIIVFVVILLVSTLALSSCIIPGVPQTAKFDRSYSSEPGMVVTVFNTEGNVKVVESVNGSVIVHAEKKSSFGKSELDKVKIVVTEGKEFTVRTERTPGARVSVNYSISVPQNVTFVNVESTNGAIIVRDVGCNISVKTTNGKIDISGVRGTVSASTSNGELIITGSKSVSSASTSNGKVSVELFEIPANGTTIRTSNGRVNAKIFNSVNANLYARTTNGKISSSNMHMNVTESSSTHLAGTFGYGGPEISIETTNGNIYLSGTDTPLPQ